MAVTEKRLTFKERTHVTIEYTPQGEDRLDLSYEIGDKILTIKPGLNKLPIGLWHAFGGTVEGQAALGSGVFKPVCIDHDFVTKDDGITPDPEWPHCRTCGSDRKTAAAEKKRRAYEATPEGQAALAKDREERAAAAAHHAEVVKVAAEQGHEAAQKMAVEHPGNKPAAKKDDKPAEPVAPASWSEETPADLPSKKDDKGKKGK